MTINLKIPYGNLFCILFCVFWNSGIVLSHQRCFPSSVPATYGYIVPAGDIFVEYGNPLDLMCILHPTIDLNISFGLNASSLLSFENDEGLVPPQFIEVVNSTAIKLHKDKPPVTASGIYKCLWDNHFVCGNYVTIGKPPPEDVDFGCISHNWENLTCSWTVPKPDFNNVYKLTCSVSKLSRIRQQCQSLKKKDNLLTCFWIYSTEPSYRVAHPFYFFKLEISNRFGKIEISKNFCHFSLVLPGPPQKLEAVDTTQSSIELFWVLPIPLQYFPPGLHHRIFYQCEFCEKKWHFGGLITTKTNKNVNFLLNNLEYPNALYEIKVASRSAVAAPDDEAMWSQNTSVTVRTSSKEPSAPPKVAGFEIAIHPQYREAYIYWRQISDWQKNGPDFRYDIIVEGQPEIQKTEITNTYAKFKYLLPSSSYTFRVWSQNTNGTSLNTSSLSIPSEENRVKEPRSFTKIELGDGEYELMWEPPELRYSDYVTNYTIFWCNSERERPHRCDGLFDWEDVSNVTFKRVSLEKHKHFQFAISVSTRNGTSGMSWAECTVVPNKSPTKIQNVWIKQVGPDFLELAWKLECSNRVGKIDGYIVNYCTVKSTHQSDCTDSQKSTIFYGGSSVQSGTITNLKPVTTYMVTLSVLIKDKQFGPQSDTFYGTTRNCNPTATRYNHRQTCAGNLIFNEDFTNLSSLWSPEIKFAGAPDYEFVLYGSKPENLQVQNGVLRIRPVPSDELFGEGFVNKEQVDLGTQCSGIPGTSDCVQKPVAFLILPPVTSAQITTKSSFSFKFGKVEIRAKLPEGDWIYPELYLNSVNDDYGPGYASGQIRIAFLLGNKDSSENLQMGGVLGSSRAARNYAMKNIKKKKDSWGKTFHRFTVIWRPDRITVKVDGHSYGNIFAPRGGFISESQNLELEDVDRWRGGTLFAPFDQEMYLSIGVGVGGHCFDDRIDGTKPWLNNNPKSQRNFYKASSQWRPSWTNASALEIDYIKIWAL